MCFLQSPVSGNAIVMSASVLSEPSVAEEYSDLLKRVATLQQEKWTIEEKVLMHFSQ